MKLLRSILCAKGRGRRPNIPKFHDKASNLLLLQVYHIKLESGVSWDNVSSWMMLLFPALSNCAKSKGRSFIEKCVHGAEHLAEEKDRKEYYNHVTDFNRIGEYK